MDKFVEGGRLGRPGVVIVLPLFVAAGELDARGDESWRGVTNAITTVRKGIASSSEEL